MAEYATFVEIDAPPEVVYSHLVSAQGWTAWMGQFAELEAVPGGKFSVDVDGAAVRGTYLEVEPPHRVVVSWGIAGSADLPPASSRVEFILTPVGAGTRLDLRHTDLPPTREAEHARGWTRFLDRLRTAIASNDHSVGGST